MPANLDSRACFFVGSATFCRRPGPPKDHEVAVLLLAHVARRTARLPRVNEIPPRINVRGRVRGVVSGSHWLRFGVFRVRTVIVGYLQRGIVTRQEGPFAL